MIFFYIEKLSPKCQDLTIVLMIDFKTGPWNSLESSLIKPETHWCLLSKAWTSWATGGSDVCEYAARLFLRCTQRALIFDKSLWDQETQFPHIWNQRSFLQRQSGVATMTVDRNEDSKVVMSGEVGRKGGNA